MWQFHTAAGSDMTAALTIYGKSISAAKVILTGFIVVFFMLFLLIICIKIYSAVIAGAQNAADKRAKRKERVMERVGDESGVHVIKKPAYITPPTVEDDVPEEVVAVIAAAVAAMMTPAVRIKSIKKAGGGRSPWAHAGVLDNTRPF